MNNINFGNVLRMRNLWFYIREIQIDLIAIYDFLFWVIWLLLLLHTQVSPSKTHNRASNICNHCEECVRARVRTNLHFTSMYMQFYLFIHKITIFFSANSIYDMVEYNLLDVRRRARTHTLSIYVSPTLIYGIIKRYGSCLESEMSSFFLRCLCVSNVYSATGVWRLIHELWLEH